MVVDLVEAGGVEDEASALRDATTRIRSECIACFVSGDGVVYQNIRNENFK
jgi:hypothetical protein